MNQVVFREDTREGEVSCCANCKWFDTRTSFCRKDPPKPVYVGDGNRQYITAVFPKIGMPELDWCSFWISAD